MANLINVLKEAGFTGEKLRIAWAIAMRESGGNAAAHNTNASTGDNSYGLFQINMLGDLGPKRDAAFRKNVEGYTGPESLLNPVVNARAMKYMSANGTNWSAWDIDKNGYDGGSHAPAFKKWYDQFPGSGGADVGGGTVSDGSAGSVGAGTADKLTKKGLAAEYEWSLKVLKSNPELWTLFKTALNDKTGQWNAKKFQAELRGTDWYKNNAEYARDAWVAEKLGGADWTQQLQDAESRVQDAMVQMGANLTPEQMKEMARKYIYQGWGDPARQSLMEQELAQYINPDAAGLYGGSAGLLQEQLTRTAQMNGLPIDNSYIQSAVRSVEAGLSDANYWDQQMRKQAASMWPSWSAEIMAGVDARDLASGYINTLAQTLEVDPYSISLDDGRLRSAVTRVDEQGKANPMGLWEFQQSLRKSPEWMGTKQAQDSVADIGVGILSRMGFM